MLRVIVNGGLGRMGFLSQQKLGETNEINVLLGLTKRDNLAEMIRTLEPDIVIDFTTPEAVFQNTEIILTSNTRAVIGTTGLTEAQIQYFTVLCEEKKLGAIIAPNFCLSAILMMKYAKDASRYFPASEIVDIHHEKKADAPSGTAIKTADLMYEARKDKAQPAGTSLPARGHVYKDTPIHSVRLPGHFAHQVTMFGAEYETLTIRYDSNSRESMMPGLRLACHKVMKLDRLVYGLEDVV